MAAVAGHLRRGQFPDHVQGDGPSEVQAAVRAAEAAVEMIQIQTNQPQIQTNTMWCVLYYRYVFIV